MADTDYWPIIGATLIIAAALFLQLDQLAWKNFKLKVKYNYVIVSPKANWVGLVCRTQQHYHVYWLIDTETCTYRSPTVSHYYRRRARPHYCLSSLLIEREAKADIHNSQLREDRTNLLTGFIFMNFMNIEHVHFILQVLWSLLIPAHTYIHTYIQLNL